MITDHVRALQMLLNGQGAQLTVDGLLGPKTQSAVDVFLSGQEKAEPDCTRLIIKRARAFGASTPQIAYLLATAEHETGGSMRPNTENLNYTSVARIRAVWPSRFPTDESAQPFVRNPPGLAKTVYNGRLGNRPDSVDGWVFRGRGLVHITGRGNYRRMGERIGVDLENDPDVALRTDVAVDCLVIGSLEGLYTGLRLGRYVGADREHADYRNARRVINSLDQADHIAALASRWERMA